MDMSGHELCTVADCLKVWRCPNLELQTMLDCPSGPLTSLSWCNNGSLVASLSKHDSRVMVCSVQRSTKITLPLLNACDVSFGHSSKRYLYVGDSKGLVTIWDMKKRQSKKVLQNLHPCGCLAINYNDSVLSVGCRDKILLHCLNSDSPPSELNDINLNGFSSLRYSHANKLMLGSVSDCGALALWDCNVQQLVYRTACHHSPATDLVFSPVNALLCITTGLDKMVAYHDLRDHTIANSMSLEFPVTCVDMHHDGKTIALGTSNGGIDVRDLRASKRSLYVASGHISSIHKIRYNPSKTKTKDTTSVHESVKSVSLEKTSPSLGHLTGIKLGYHSVDTPDSRVSLASMDGIFTPEAGKDKANVSLARNLIDLSVLESPPKILENLFNNNSDRGHCFSSLNTEMSGTNLELPSSVSEFSRLASQGIEKAQIEASTQTESCSNNPASYPDIPETVQDYVDEVREQMIKEIWSVKVSMVKFHQRIEETQKVILEALRQQNNNNFF